MRLSAVPALCCIAFASVGAAEHANAAITRRATDIPAQSLGSALEMFARERSLQLVYATDEVGSARSRGAAGNLTASDALAQILRGTGLTYRFLDANTVTVQTVRSSQAARPDALPQGVQLADGGRAPVQQVVAADPSTGATPSGSVSSATTLEEVIVTAQKKAERLQDVPIPMSVVGGAALAETNQFRLQDYGTQVPGLSVTSSDSAGAPALGIRGIAPAPFGNPTVGVTLDGIPLGSEIAFGGGSVTPELDPSDLQRIEVLRGPQGTLYGAASMGGLLKYETVDPSSTVFAGRAEAGFSLVSNARHPGYDVSGAINVPATATLGVRASAFARWEPGFIDDIQTGARGVNSTQVAGGHLAALWRPVSTSSVKLGALFEDNRQSGEPYITVGPGQGDLQQAFMPNAGRLVRKFEAYSATVTAKLGAASLVSVTGYNINDQLTPLDNSFNLGPLVSLVFPASNAFEIDLVRTNKLTQELRLTAPLGRHLDWLVGGYFSHERNHSYSNYEATQADSVPLGQFAFLASEIGFTEWAAFSDLTCKLTDRFDVQFGARASRMRQTFSEVDTGPYVPIVEGQTPPYTYPRAVATESATTYLFTPRLKITPDIMLYARFASGFRPGGTNVGVIPPGVPRDFKPDKTQNYELGAKAEVLDHRLFLDGALYRIDWKDLQLFLNVPATAFGYYSNGSQAKTQGLELSATAHPLRGLSTGAWVSWNDSVLTRDMPSNSLSYGVSGDRLPFSSRFSANVSVDYAAPLGRATASIGATETYVGERLGAFVSTPQRQVYPAYAKTDFRASLVFDSWTWNVYANNAFDRRGIVGGGLGSYFPNAFVVIQPRTVGTSVALAF